MMDHRVANIEKNIAVIGGAGFIGSHLVNRLIKEKTNVVVIDDLSTGSRDNINEQACFYQMKGEDAGVRDVLLSKSIQAVYFLAANSNVPLSVRDPLYDFNSLVCALNVIETCRHTGVERLIFTSSGFIYGNTKTRPINEETIFQPISPYAISKRAIENYLEFYKEVYGLSCIILRLATVYGPRQVTGALSDYITKLAAGEQADFFGDGSKTRDYVYVDDVVDALIMSLEINDLKSPIMNIGSGREIALIDAYRKVAELLGREPRPSYQPDRPGELYGYSLSYEKAKKVMGWEPRTNFREGLKKILEYRGLLPSDKTVGIT